MRGYPSCMCCGGEWQAGGCVLGYRCACDRTTKCEVCTKCVEHHHQNCTDAVRLEYIAFVSKLRDRSGINIFESGAVKESRVTINHQL